MSGGFGRKGVVTGAPMPRMMGSGMGNPRPSPTVSGPEAGLSPEARAFLAAERSRSADERRPPESPAISAAESAMRLAPAKPKSDRSMLMAYILWWFGPTFAAHRFYLGAYRSAVVMAGLFWGGLALGAIMSKKSSLWVGGLAVPPFWAAMILGWLGWCLVDAFLIPGLMRRYRAGQRSENLSHVFA